MKHDEIVREIQIRAAARGVLSHYCGRSERCAGDAGMPDLVIVGRSCAAWIEVKTAAASLEPAQVRWKYQLAAVGQIHEIMHEADLVPGGAVDALLEFTATGGAA